MYDRQVRRRRAVLAALVALSLVLLTAYFGESGSGGLHSVQRGALGVLGPIQEGASRALKPFRDLFGWIGDTIDAKQERDALVRQRDSLEKQVAKLQSQGIENDQLRKLHNINTEYGVERYDPVAARVVSRSPNLFYSTLTIDKGSSAGVRVDQPVVATSGKDDAQERGSGGLVGRVAEVGRGYSVIVLITDREFAVSARTLDSNQPGIVQPAVGSPGDLLLEVVDDADDVREGDRVVTAGTTSSRLESLFPAGIPIGKVRRVDLGNGPLERTIHVRPAVELRELQWVEVLTGNVTAVQARRP